MNKEFKIKYLQQSMPVDDEYELYVRAWMAYHEAANRVDGHLPTGHPDQGRIGHLAVKAGKDAMSKHISLEVVADMVRTNDWESYHKWQTCQA